MAERCSAPAREAVKAKLQAMTATRNCFMVRDPFLVKELGGFR